MLEHTNSEAYYTKMVIAWLGQVLYLNYPQVITNYLQNENINPLTKKLTIRKLLDSFRVSDPEKENLKRIRQISK